MLRAVLDGAIWAATLITLVSCAIFFSSWEDRSSGIPATVIGILLAALGTGATLLSRKYNYTNGTRLSASIAVIAVPVILLGLMQTTGIWPQAPVDLGYKTADALYDYDHRSLPLACLAVAIPTLIVGLEVGLKLRAGPAVGVAFAAVIAIAVAALSLTDIDISSISVWVAGGLTAAAAACALLAERKDRALATWLHPFVIVGVPTTIANSGLWGDESFKYGWTVAILVALAVAGAVTSVLLSRTLYAVAAGTALIAAEIVLFNDLVRNPALALAVSLLTGLGLVVGIVVAVVKRGGVSSSKTI